MHATKAYPVDSCPIHQDAVACYGGEPQARLTLKRATDAYVAIDKVRDRMVREGMKPADFAKSQMGRCLAPLAEDIDFILNGAREETKP